MSSVLPTRSLLSPIELSRLRGTDLGVALRDILTTHTPRLGFEDMLIQEVMRVLSNHAENFDADSASVIQAPFFAPMVAKALQNQLVLVPEKVRRERIRFMFNTS